jgi:diguanylate cyclase (GGDEF)-like protein/PAS domain S-box-containing protein
VADLGTVLYRLRGRVEPDGEFRRLTGRAMGLLCLLSGVVTILDTLTMFDRATTIAETLLAVGATVAIAGAVMLRLPWHRWPQRAMLITVVPALVLIGIGNWVDPAPYEASIFLFLLAVWLGTAQPRGTVLAFSPLFALAYWWPIAIVPHTPGLTQSVPYVIAVCVLAGESLAWLTARLHAVQRLLRDHDGRRFQALLAASSDTTVLLSAAGEMTYVSPSAVRVLRLPAEELSGQRIATFIDHHVHPGDAAELNTRLDGLLAGDGTEETIRFRVAGASSAWCDIEGAGRNLLGDEAVRGVLLNLRDVSERTQLEHALTQQAFTDQLTGLPNRTLLHERTEQALALAARHGYAVALLLIDLDRFKEVNDTLGHHYGDVLLQQMAERLGTALRDSDTVARLGGDEFAVLLPQISTIADVIGVAEKIRTAIEAPFLVEALSMDVDASIGLAVYPDHAGNADELLQRADVAMYAAKAAHLDYVLYEPRLDQHSPRRLGLLGQIRRAIANRELVVYYQPKAEAHSGRLIGLEALVRWQHPEHGLLGPNEFIPLAETTGLIRPLTSYVLQTALGECRTWRDAGHDLSVAVNASARCLLDLSLPVEIASLLGRYGIAADRLVLEITESAIMNDPNRALEVLNRLHALGVHLSIDDFGTGYSSMAYLKNLPVDELKIDRSFVTHMRQRQSERVIVRSTIDLAHNLGLRVVAEGVEDQETWQELDLLGCDTIQGYHLAKPMSASALNTWLVERPQPASARF